MSHGIITLTTDFGEGSPYIAHMKGVILGINPNVHLVDISHSVRPQDVRHGALTLGDVAPHFPPGSIHVAVIDPGVGTGRELFYSKCGGQHFLAPDNGLLTVVAQAHPPEQLIALTERRYWRESVSRTFHGRDILAPAAAHLSLGLSPQKLGSRREKLTRLAIPEPVQAGNRVSGTVILIDSFGNLITNITAPLLPSHVPQSLQIQCHERCICGLTGTYAESSPGSVVAIVGSSSRLEIAIVNGNAAMQLQIGLNAPVVVEW